MLAHILGTVENIREPIAAKQAIYMHVAICVAALLAWCGRPYTAEKFVESKIVWGLLQLYEWEPNCNIKTSSYGLLLLI